VTAPVRTRTRRSDGPSAPPPQAPPPPRAAAEPAPAALDDSFRATWRADLGAGLVVFLVALPLCLGISLASGAPLLSGVVTGVVGGLLVSRLSGSQLMVSGPAAGLTAIVAAAILELGSFQVFLAAVVIAGAMQLALGAMRLGIIAYFFPTSVIRGMLAAIGLILIFKQLPYALGAGIVPQDETGGSGLLGPTIAAARALSPEAAGIALGALALLVLWPKLAPAGLRKVLPGPLAVVVLGVAVNAVLLSMGLGLAPSQLVQLPVAESLGDVVAFVAFPDFSRVADPVLWRVAATLAIVASLETLLSLEATDKLDPYKRTSPANRELLAQGVGNATAGLIGGLPMTGVIVRSSANINSGARTWRSAFIHGVMLTLAVVGLARLINYIPLAALAAILLHTGYKLANPATLRDAWKVGPQQAVPFVVTIVAIIATDLLVGIGIGLAVGTFFLLLESYRNAYSYDLDESADHKRVRLTLAEEVTFLNKPRVAAALSQLPRGAVVTVDASRTRHFDHDVVELLHDFRETARAKGITYRTVGVPEPTVGGGGH
jgi:MFS superfamily sulfate permease-like transporter